jgi:hypothetical protein
MIHWGEGFSRYRKKKQSKMHWRRYAAAWEISGI